MTRVIKGLFARVVLCLLMAATGQASNWPKQIWDNIHFEAVQSFGCSIHEVTLSDGVSGDPNWVLEGIAKRDGMEDWALSLGYYPGTIKGREDAMKDCNKWLKEAERRMRKFQDARVAKYGTPKSQN